MGKAGAQWNIFGVEAEGPSAGAGANAGGHDLCVFAEASAGRAEVHIGPVGARIEPNVNTGIGIRGNNIQARALGFGISLGSGVGIHTPLGSIGLGEF